MATRTRFCMASACAKDSTMRCRACGKGYCSTLCATADKHLEKCVTLKALLEKDGLCARPGCDVVQGHNKKCGACKSVRYCSTECQKLDWADHKKTCRETPDPLTHFEKHHPCVYANFVARWPHNPDVVYILTPQGVSEEKVPAFLRKIPKPSRKGVRVARQNGLINMRFLDLAMGIDDFRPMCIVIHPNSHLLAPKPTSLLDTLD